jgi:hypothetical protein
LEHCDGSVLLRDAGKVQRVLHQLMENPAHDVRPGDAADPVR